MAKPTYEELWNRTKKLEKENQGLSQTIEMLKKDAWIYQKLIESANSIILKIDLKGNVKFINAFAQEFFGYPEKEIIGQNVIGTIVPQTESSGRDLSAMFNDLGYHPERYLNNENENMKRDGQKVWIAWTNKGIQNEAGNISEIICVGNDISRRRLADKALQESEKKFRSVTEQSPNMIFINKNGRITYCNRKCEEIMGYTIDEFCSQDFDFFNLISSESKDAVMLAFEKHMKGKEVEPYEYSLITKDGRKLNAIITTKMIQYEGEINL